MLDNPHPDYFRESTKTVDMFIRKSSEKNIKDFFLRDIDGLLANYEPGLPKMKPDVLKQIKEIEAEREKMIKDEMAKQKANGPIMLQQPGKEPVALSNQEIVNLMQQQQESIQQLTQKNGEMENMVTILQKQIIEKTKTIREMSASKPSEDQSTKITELETVITMLQKQLIEKTKTIREFSSNENADQLKKQNTELEKMVSQLQVQLLEKTKALQEANRKLSDNNNSIIEPTKPSEIIVEDPISIRSKSDPEVIIDMDE
jgi:hypothetical protein